MRKFQSQGCFPTRRTRSLQWIGSAAVVVLTIGAAQPQQDPASTVHREVPYLPQDAIRLPDKNDQMQMNQQQAKKQSFEAANIERKKQIVDDAARLLQLATELKSEVDKTDKDTLSLNVIRKAETIEKLAKGVKEKMKLTVGGS